MRRASPLLFPLLALPLFYLALGIGEQWIDPLAPASAMERDILWELRFPRLLTAFAVGGLLALAGAWFQVLLGNALAEPYVLGVAGSAAAGAVSMLAIAVGSVWLMSAGAFGGALLGILLIMAFVRLDAGRLLLAGVVLAAFWGAVVTLLLALMSDRDLSLAFAWMLGDLSASDIPPPVLLLVLGAALLFGVRSASALDAMMLGERHASMLGFDVAALRHRLLLVASLATAVAVTAAGTIGFVGLVVPHLMRLLFGSLHRRVLPASAVGGGLLLALADTASRTLIAPMELPVGVLTAMIGVPIFLRLLVRRG